MRWTTLFSLCILFVLLAGCYNAGYEPENKETEQNAAEPAPQKDAGDLGEQGLLDILEEAEKGGDDASASDSADAADSADSVDAADTASSDDSDADDAAGDADNDADDADKDNSDAGSETGSETSETGEESAEAEKAEASVTGAAGSSAKDVTSDITVTEGELVELKLKAYDPDGDKLAFTYGAPLDQNGRWQTKNGDEGSYKVDVIASDGMSRTVKAMTIRVLHRNRAPIIEPLQKIVVNEGDTINLAPRVRDPEGQPVKVTYSGWMTEPRRETSFEDAGTYRVTIAASDGEFDVTSYVDIEVKNVNRAPVFEAVIE